MKIKDRLSHAWNAFIANDKPNSRTQMPIFSPGNTSTYRLDRTPLRIGTERSILASIYNRIAIDVAAIEIRHAKVNEDDSFQYVIRSGLNECLSVSANKDQTARAFLMDVVLSMFDEGVVAVVPVDTTLDITKTNSYDIQSLRTGKITQWMPDHVRVEVYNDRLGQRSELVLPKKSVAIIENPLYQVMNEPNSTLQRLKHKLALLDATDDKQNSDKLNMIIQLPYSIKSQSRLEAAEERRKQVEMQLTDSKYGIAYIDGTEKIIQIGKPLENRLIEQITYFTDQLYAQLGLTPQVFNGTANEQEMVNYNSRTVEPIVSAIVDEMHRKFLTKTARTQGQAIKYYRNPFALTTVDNLSNVANVFTQSEILSSDEIRALIGYKPMGTNRSQELSNKNINPIASDPDAMEPAGGFDQNGNVDEEYDENQFEDESEFESEPESESDYSDMISDDELENMSEEEIQQYIAQLEAFDAELDELDRQSEEE